jgi:hypothetical protein
MERPPPLPKSPSSNASSFARQAARASWMAPLAAICLNIFSYGILQTQPDQYRMWGKMIVGGLACLLILTGFLLGVIALFGMSKYGRRDILGSALAGIIINGLLIALAVAAIPAFMKAKERAEATRKSMAQIKESAKGLNDEARRQLHDGSDPKRTTEKITQLQKSLLDAAQNTSGDDSLALRASSAYVQKLSALKTNYDAALAQLKTAGVLKASTITDKSLLASRRTAVTNFLAANEDFKDFISHGAECFRAECDRLHIPAATTDSAVQGYRKKADLINPLIVSMRESDEEIGQGMLGIISLEEINWGHWSASSAGGKIRFEDPALVKTFNSYLKQIRDASDEEARTQQKLLEVNQATAP